jgi:arsenate reductase
MAKTYTIYHNPRCSKSRETLALLRSHGIEPDVVEYLKTPPTYDQLTSLLSMLGLKPRQLIRKGEPDYKALGLDDPSLSDDALVRAMAEHPVLIERPIVVTGTHARLGRPPENVLEIL